MDNFHSHFRYVLCKISEDNSSIDFEIHLSSIRLFVCLFFYRFQPKINRIFLWSNKLRNIHLITLIGCIYLFFRFPSMNHYSTDLIQSSLPESSGSSMIYNIFEQAAMSKCCPITSSEKLQISFYKQYRISFLPPLYICRSLFIIIVTYSGQCS
jgi:hypothetical protein